jgi:hypothetical protein
VLKTRSEDLTPSKFAGWLPKLEVCRENSKRISEGSVKKGRETSGGLCVYKRFIVIECFLL